MERKYLLCFYPSPTGVRVSRSGMDVDIRAPLVISDAGVINTFTNLLPKEIAEKSVQKAGAVFSDLTALNAGLKSLTENLVGALDDTGLTALDNLTTSVTETVVKNLENILTRTTF